MRPDEISFSVVIPTHNRPDDLARALESLARQTHRNFEVIVINDGEQRILDTVRQCPLDNALTPVTLCRTSGNLGPSAARNGGLDAARGEVIAYLDDDDIYQPDHLAVHAVRYAADPSVRVVYSDAERGLLDGDSLSREVIHSRDFDADALMVANYIPILCLSHRRECLEKSGKFEESLHYLEDWDFFLRLSEFWPFVHVPQPTAMYVEKKGGQSIQQRFRGDFIASLNAVYKRSDRILAADPVRQERVWKQRFAHLGRMAHDTGAHLEGIDDLASAEQAYLRATEYAPGPDYYLSLSRVQKALGKDDKALVSMQLAQRCRELGEEAS